MALVIVQAMAKRSTPSTSPFTPGVGPAVSSAVTSRRSPPRERRRAAARRAASGTRPADLAAVLVSPEQHRLLGPAARRGWSRARSAGSCLGRAAGEQVRGALGYASTSLVSVQGTRIVPARRLFHGRVVPRTWIVDGGHAGGTVPWMGLLSGGCCSAPRDSSQESWGSWTSVTCRRRSSAGARPRAPRPAPTACARVVALEPHPQGRPLGAAAWRSGLGSRHSPSK